MTNHPPSLPRASRRHRVGFLTLVLLAGLGCRREPPDPTGAVTARTLGLVYLQENKLDQAEAEFRKVVRFAPDQALGYANLGLVLLRRDRYPDAERQLERAVRLDSANVRVRLMLIRVRELSGQAAEARAELDRLVASHPDDPAVLYAEAELAGPTDSSRTRLLARLVDAAPRNLAPRIELAVSLAREGHADTALATLEALRQLPPEPPPEAAQSLTRAIAELRGGRADSALPALLRYRHLLETTAAYQAGLQQIQGPGSALVGYPVLTFRPNFEIRERVGREAESTVVRFADGTEPARLGGVGAAPLVLSGDLDGDGIDDLVIGGRLLHDDGGEFGDTATGVTIDPAAVAGVIADLDNDGRLDLYLVDPAGVDHLYLGVEGGRLREARAPAEGLAPVEVRAVRAVDLDHDGDLDLVEATDRGLRVLRNDLDGTYRDVSREMGLGPGPAASDVAVLDLDGDGLIDLYLAGGAGGDRLYRNTGMRRFDDVTARAGLTEHSTRVAVGDYDNDGRFDLALAGQGVRMLRNRGGGRFEPDAGAEAGLSGLRSDSVRALRFLDYDNDGRLDLAAVTADRIALFRGEAAGFRDRSGSMPPVAGVTSLAVADYDKDGDLDLVAATAAGPRLLRNDGGNVSQYLDVQLTGLRTGSGKNNDFGIGARIEVRAGELYQTRLVTDRVTHFGLADQLKADVVRIEWPNGVPQTVFFPGSNQDVLEQQILKGSCAFLYAWDGERYAFVGDVIWKSALGMPLGIMGSEGGAFAPPQASREYLLIPGEKLRPQDGRYRIQLTEELWETAFLDQVHLLAVDHPDSVRVALDEKFVPPSLPAALQVRQLVGLRPPAAAIDQSGRDLLPLLAHRDDRYVGGFEPTRYQGLVAPHDLILDLGVVPAGPTYLVLTGWIFPTDASINVAVGQGHELEGHSPSLEVMDPGGRWRPVTRDIGFPSGKDKTVLVDLTGRLRPGEHRVRIRTNLAIYWDQAQVGSAIEGPSTVTPLAPIGADLHQRGYSRVYRKGGRYGPHWFDYDSVTRASPWRPIAGHFTRFGNVLPLLGRADDEYVIMAPGDETTVEFDPAGLPALPVGWTRDFVLYTDGWIKDADRNTAHGQTVEPLPFHAIGRYPPGPDDAYPADSAHRAYRERYNTRTVRFQP